MTTPLRFSTPIAPITKPASTTVSPSHAIQSVLAKPASPPPLTTFAKPAAPLPLAPLPAHTAPLAPVALPLSNVRFPTSLGPMTSLTPPPRSTPPASAPVFRAPSGLAPAPAPMPKLIPIRDLARDAGTQRMSPIGKTAPKFGTFAQGAPGAGGASASPGASNDYPAAGDAGSGFGGGFYPPGYDPSAGGDDSALPPDPQSDGASSIASPADGGAPSISPAQARALSHMQRMRLLAQFVAYYTA